MWFLLSFLTAIFRSLNDIAGKYFVKDRDVYSIGLSMRLWSSLILIPLMLFTDMVNPDKDFYSLLLISGILNSLVTVLYFNSLKKSDISLSMPILTLTPVFMIFTSPFITGEMPSIKGVFGIILIVIGAYSINIDKSKGGLMTPILSLINGKGTRSMLFVALIWSVSAPIDKLGVESSSPLFWGTSVNVFMVFSIYLFILFTKKDIDNKALKLFWPGIFAALTIITQMTALKLAIVPYVIAIKRTSILFSVIAGIFLFKEKGGVHRLISTFLMVVGVMIILLS